MYRLSRATRLQRASAPVDERCASEYLPKILPQSLLLSLQIGNSEYSRDGHQPRISTRGRVHAFAADPARRSFAARAVSRNSGSESFRHRSNSHSRDFIPKEPIAYAPQDFSQGSSLFTSAVTACSWFSILVPTSRLPMRARSATVILPSSSGTSISRNWDFKTLSR